MNLLKKFSSDEKEFVEKELSRLFLLQDRKLDEDRKAFLMGEIEAIGVPCEYVLLGLRSLGRENIKSLKFAVLEDAIKQKYKPRGIRTNCHECCGVGILSKKDEKGYAFAYSCKCEAGRQYNFPGLPT